jgi:fumarate reductase flavoprotein subunit
VFGGIAGDVMPGWIAKNPGHRAPDEAMIEFEMARALHPFTKARGDINSIREEMLNLMWDDVGIIRDATGLKRGLARLEGMETELLASGIADRNRGFNLTWHDWLNLRSQIEVSKVIALAAMQRENSRGAHYRDDFKEPGDLETSTYTIVREKAGKLNVTSAPVQFTIVKPGETLLKGAEAAE